MRPRPANRVAVDDAANGTTVELPRGARLTVTLHSTYWQLAAPADASVLDVSTVPAARPDPSCRSIPGAGCGTVTAVYTATGTGTTTLTAHRDELRRGAALHAGAERLVLEDPRPG